MIILQLKINMRYYFNYINIATRVLKFGTECKRVILVLYIGQEILQSNLS